MRRHRLAAAAVAYLALAVPAMAQSTVGPRHSGFFDMTPATQAMQRDDGANPAWLWREAGRRRFDARCTGCHTAASLAGAATRLPAWDARTGRPMNLGQHVSRCHDERTGGGPLAPEADARIELESYLASLARGEPVAPSADPRLDPWRERGRRFFEQRMGQLDLACATCHERFAGRRLGGSTIPQGHPTGYPIYRLEWQGMGSLQRRIRGCLSGVRAEPLAPDGDEAVALELFLMQRAAGLALESPAVRP